MKELLRQLREGEFEQYEYFLKLKSGVNLWTGNGRSYYRLYPESGDGFTWSERRAIGKAIKEGRMKQALSPLPTPLT